MRRWENKKLFKHTKYSYSMELIGVYITFPNEKEADKIVNHLLGERLICCANVFPVKTSYWWKGKIEQGDEVISICKTQEKHWKKLKETVEGMHSYEVPCITKFSVESNEAYDQWIKGET